MAHPKEFQIAVIPGDGIGPEIMKSCVKVLETLQANIGGFRLNMEHLPAGAEYYRQNGIDISEEAFEKARQADAILLGAIGLPDVRFPDGTEIAPHLRMRVEFDLYAGVRPVRAFPEVPSPLADPRAAKIDIIVLRECTEGLFASHGKGEVLDDREAKDTLVITRSNCERFFDFGFRLARKRKETGGKGKITCVDKANVFRSYAFFRKIFTERARLFPDVTAGYSYIDAMALDLVRRPWEFDVLVAENMFADILSDLGGGIIGGMGMAPCAEIGENHGLFQPAHGSAPDIAGTSKANPTAMLLSAAMMLDWLGNKHDHQPCIDAAGKLEAAIVTGLQSGNIRPMEFGGPHGTEDVARAAIDCIEI
ncbi:MAG: isocitrate/isopropylmalate dehydrogenase family protein [Deltaproteobacteria bacterium]|nr:isocitrate/isopropylmalate dehydrogenase family protein [Deltaproteobacteria bacterium]MBW1960572.1 isocitrate/isopropylmalate dehydrogenase family protein [Deltaproteobacteria bacterium]MBW1993543.1 isocitrate/isopropylmalate dehydrogenase family protein [Deltaproteobacteria bacterium]MBW2151250.1 isocitrate/isopropylmalate dehydrogenase family protein [Deltaproteobacteria bacterium]